MVATKGHSGIYNRTEEHKRKISESHKGEKHPMYGKKHTNEAKRKMSIAKIGKYTKENSPNWQGGKSFMPYGLDFDNKLRKIIKIRDNYQCRECGIKEMESKYYLDVHHIDYNKQNNTTFNLITLCRKCHAKTNFNRKTWVEYYKNKYKDLLR